MKIAKHITFYYTEQTKYRINYINKIIHACESYMYTTDLFIHINVQIDILVNLIRYNNGNIYHISMSILLLKKTIIKIELYLYIYIYN